MLKTLTLPIIALCVPMAGAFAADAPSMKGTWLVKMEGNKIQLNAGPAPHNVDLAAPKTGKFAIDITVTIDKEDGYAFSGKKASARASETIAGVVDYDNAHLSMVEGDGTTRCTVQSPDRLVCTYFEINPANSIAGRQIWTRKK